MQKFDNFRKRINNMKTLDTLYDAALSKINEVKWQRENLNDEVDQLKEKLDGFTAIMDKALADEDFETYKKASEEKAETEFVYSAKVKKLEAKMKPQAEEFLDDWNAFKDEYEREFKEAYPKYKEARKALYEQYKALQDLQKKAVMLRKRIGILCGFSDSPWGHLELDYYYMRAFGEISAIEARPTRNAITRLGPDAAFFASVGLLPAECDEESYKVVAIQNL